MDGINPVNDTMGLWRSVRDVPPECQKGFQRTGGFSGTAITAMWFIQKATEVFGPVGKGWGWTLEDDRFVEGAPIVLNGAVVGREILHMARVSVWYVMDGQRYTYGPQFGQTMFVTKRGNAVVTIEEAPKMSLTDGLKKCLSALGFGAGVWLGDFTDDKYVRGAETAPHPIPLVISDPAPPARPPAQPSIAPLVAEAIPAPDNWSDETQRSFFLVRLRSKVEQYDKSKAPAAEWDALYAANKAAIDALAQHDPAKATSIKAFIEKRARG